MVTSTNHVIAGRIYFALGPWHFGDFRNIFLPNIGEEQKKSYDFSSGTLAGTQARSQKFTMGGMFWGSGGGASSARKFCIFSQNELNFRAILIKNIAFKTWRRNWQRNIIQLAVLMGYMGSGYWLMITLQFSCLLAGKS